jgi:hypothetical protein
MIPPAVAGPGVTRQNASNRLPDAQVEQQTGRCGVVNGEM